MSRIGRSAWTLTPIATLAALALALPARAGVLVVNEFGTGFTEIQPAVDAAVDGDIILMKAGTYPGFTITDKSLIVTVEPGAGVGSVNVDGAVQVLNLAAARTVRLDWLTGVGTSATQAGDPNSYGLRVSNCAGHVRVQSCDFTGAQGTFLAGLNDGVAGVRVENSSDVLLSGCTVEGGRGRPNPCDSDDFMSPGGKGGDGLTAAGSQVAAYDCTIRGGKGGQGCFLGGAGGTSTRLTASIVFSSKTSWVGGDGEQALEDPCAPGSGTQGGNGGDVLVMDAGSTARLLETAIMPGAGAPIFQCGAAGLDGNAVLGGGSLVALPGPAKFFGLDRSVKVGQNASLEFGGASGDNVFLFLASGAGSTYIESWQGVFGLSFPLVGPFFAGSVPAGGVLQYGVPIPGLPGILGLGVSVQPLFLDANSNVTLGGPAYLTILDAGL